MGEGDKGVGGSRPRFEGLGGPLAEAMHSGAGDPWCRLGTSPRSLSSKADHGRVRWLVGGETSSFQMVVLGFSFSTLGRDELEDASSERVFLEPETEFRVLQSNTQRVPPLDFDTSTSDPIFLPNFGSFPCDFTPLGH